MSVWADLEESLSSCTENPSGELALLTEAVTGLEPERFRLLRLRGDLPDLTPQQTDRLAALIQRRRSGIPVQYLVGRADVYGRSFSVREGVLIPRFDTEILIDTALKHLRDGDSILDLCAGSGCIGFTLGAELRLSVTSVEKFDAAFSVLCENRDRICPSARLIQGDVLSDPVDGVYDMILSNPPYIPTSDLSSLSAEVQKEPVTALDGGDDGLDFYRIILRRYAANLRDGGFMLFECGIGQASAIAELFREAGYDAPFTVRDYGGVERVVGAQRSKEIS